MFRRQEIRPQFEEGVQVVACGGVVDSNVSGPGILFQGGYFAYDNSAVFREWRELVRESGRAVAGPVGVLAGVPVVHAGGQQRDPEDQRHPHGRLGDHRGLGADSDAVADPHPQRLAQLDQPAHSGGLRPLRLRMRLGERAGDHAHQPPQLHFLLDHRSPQRQHRHLVHTLPSLLLHHQEEGVQQRRRPQL